MREFAEFLELYKIKKLREFEMMSKLGSASQSKSVDNGVKTFQMTKDELA